MAKRKRKRRRHKWHGEPPAGKTLRERRPYKKRRALGRTLDGRPKKIWFTKFDNKFFWSGDWRNLQLAARAVLRVLVHLADGPDAYQWIEASDPDLMYYTGLTRPTIYDALCNLKDHGCIKGQRTSRRPARYRLTVKVIGASHARPAKRARPQPAKPQQKAKRKAKAPQLEIPDSLAAAITPAEWQTILAKHTPEHIADVLSAYTSQEAREIVRDPVKLLSTLLSEFWVGRRADVIRDESRLAAAREARRQAESAELGRQRQAAQEKAIRHDRPFTQKELDAYSMIALKNIRALAPGLDLQPHSAAWTDEMWRLVDHPEKTAARTAEIAKIVQDRLDRDAQRQAAVDQARQETDRLEALRRHPEREFTAAEIAQHSQAILRDFRGDKILRPHAKVGSTFWVQEMRRRISQAPQHPSNGPNPSRDQQPPRSPDAGRPAQEPPE